MDMDNEEQLRAAAQYEQAVNAVIQLGRDDFGETTFDEMSRDLVGAVGQDALPSVMLQLLQTDCPTRLVEYGSNNPEWAKKLAKMSPARRAAELGRIEALLLPNGAGGGDDPAWITRIRGRDHRGAGNGLGDDVDDRTWERNFKKLHPDWQHGYCPGRSR